MLLENLTKFEGDLKESFLKLKPETIQHSDKITKDGIDDDSLRGKYFYTADHAFYNIQGKKPMIHLGRVHTNPIFKHIEEAYDQLINNDNYIPSEEDIKAIINDESTLTTEISALELINHNDEVGYFKVNILNPFKKLNSEQRKVAKRVFGRGHDFVESMKMLKYAGIDETSIYMLTEDYVKAHTKDNEGISRACWLYLFSSIPFFIPYSFACGVSDSRNWLRGVPIIAEDETENINTIPTLKNILDISKGYVPEKLSKEFEKKIRTLYKN